MTEERAQPPQERTLHLMLVDQDEVFRLGLRLWLNRFSALQVVAEASSMVEAWRVLALDGTHEPDNASAANLEPAPIDLVIFDIGLGAPSQGLTLCQRIKAQRATLPLLLLTSQRDEQLLAAAFQSGVDGYCTKGMAIADLVAVIRQISAGQKYWDPSIQVLALTRGPARIQPSPPGTLSSLLYNSSVPGLQEMEDSLAGLTAQLQIPTLSWFERAFIAGRRREILAARWVANRLLPAPAATAPGERLPTSLNPVPEQPHSTALLRLYSETDNSEAQSKTLKSILFETTARKLQSNLQNVTGMPLETDILRLEKKRELFYLILRKLEAILDELRFSQVQPSLLAEKRLTILQDLWQATTTDFFGKYYTLQISRLTSSGVRNTEIVPVLLQDAETVQAALLDKIPLVEDLLACLLFQTPLEIDNHAYSPDSLEAVIRAEAILQNLMIQVANGVLQPLLNQFADVEVIKQNLYHKRLLSTREIEKFRNALSWKYRLRSLIHEPKEIFESRFRLFVLREWGVDQTSIYVSRSQELRQLSGLRLGVTIALELRDAVAPPLRSVVAFLGKGAVYLLTQVIGRGIGLVGRGIVQGVGSSWQDIRLNRKGQQQKE